MKKVNIEKIVDALLGNDAGYLTDVQAGLSKAEMATVMQEVKIACVARLATLHKTEAAKLGY